MADTVTINASSTETVNISETMASNAVKNKTLEILDYHVNQEGNTSDVEMDDEEPKSGQTVENCDGSIPLAIGDDSIETGDCSDQTGHDDNLSIDGNDTDNDDDTKQLKESEERLDKIENVNIKINGDASTMPQDYRSQYHSIYQLSLPASCQTGNNNVSSASSTTQPPSYDLSFNMNAYSSDRRPFMGSVPPEGDSLLLLRNLMHSNSGGLRGNSSPNRWDTSSPLALCRNRREKLPVNSEDENDKPVDMTGYDASQKDDYDDSLLRSPSDLSISSRGDLSDEDEGSRNKESHCSIRNGNKLGRDRKHKSSQRFGREFDLESYGMNDDSASMSDDQGSSDDVMEAKRARMEAIVSTMRISPSDRNSSNLDHSATTITHFKNDRRARRKQCAPKQHDVSSFSLEEDRASTTGGKIEKQSLQQELRHMQDQLAEMKQKYSILLHKENSTKHKSTDSHLEQIFKEEQMKDLSRRIQESACDLVNRQLSQSWLSFANDINCNGHDYGKSSPVGGASPVDVEHLSGMLKAEIAASVGSLVDEIVKNFVKKHKLGNEYLDVHKNQSPSKRSDGGETSDDDNDESRDYRMESGTKSKEDEQFSRQELTPLAQIPSSMFIPQPMPPAMAQILANFSEYSMMNRFGCLPKSLGKSADRFVPPFLDQHIQKSAFDLPRPTGLPLFPSHPFFSNSSLSTPAAAACLFPREPEQTEALPLVVSAPTKKKRTKVTDTRLSPRAARAILQDSVPHAAHQGSTLSGRPDHASSGRNEPTPGDHVMNESTMPSAADYSRHLANHFTSQSHLLPASLPTSVAVPNPSLQHSDILKAIYSRHQLQQRHQLDLALKQHQLLADASGRSSRSSSPGEVGGGERVRNSVGGGSDGYAGGYRSRGDQMSSDFSSELPSYDDQSLTSTLTPVHLRKAKLMFFYVRYPSSAVIKTFFPDVKFNKNNTAQLIKWFSNFREFYYIQMEKYARQAISDGVQSPMELIISADSELYRILVLHYNRNNQIEVPDNFRMTVQATLREFFKSIQAERDQEPSWKKAIYKIIARLDDNVPEYFKSTNWMEQLVDG